jgi:hypothetical protein
MNYLMQGDGDSSSNIDNLAYGCFSPGCTECGFNDVNNIGKITPVGDISVNRQRLPGEHCLAKTMKSHIG